MSNKKEVLFLREEYGEGRGKYTYPDGTKYVGELKDGKQHGQGTHTLTDGRKFVREWKNGKPWNGAEYDKNGNIIGTVVNGKMIKQ